MSMPRYTCMESTLITSPDTASARFTTSSDLPAAVGPTTAMTGAFTALPADGHRGHADQDRTGRARHGPGPAPRGLAHLPRVARPGGARPEHRAVGHQMVRRRIADLHHDHVAGPRRRIRIGSEVDQPVV